MLFAAYNVNILPVFGTPEKDKFSPELATVPAVQLSAKSVVQFVKMIPQTPGCFANDPAKGADL